MSIKWNDVSSYSQNEKKSEIKTVELMAATLRIIVTRHIHYPGEWILNCDPFFQMKKLKSEDIEAAKYEAIMMIKKQLQASINALKG